MVENVRTIDKEDERSDADQSNNSQKEVITNADVKTEHMDQWTDRMAILVLGAIGILIIVFYFLLYKKKLEGADQLLTIVATITGALAGMIVPNFSKK